MTRALDVARLRTIIADRLGLWLEDTREAELVDALDRRVRERRIDVHRYLDAIEDWDVDEAHALGQLLTVHETYFFRTRPHFDVVRDVILPRLWERSDVRVLSAGCSTGEEPYSLAMLLRDEGWDGRHKRLRIDAVDLSERSIAKATRAIYTPWSLRETEPAARRRWFVPRGRDFEVVPEVREQVVFQRDNLFGAAPIFPDATFDFVFCRNVLMYFTPDAARAVVARLTAHLVPGGYFFLGHAETMRNLSDDYDLQNTHGTFYYRKKMEVPALPPRPTVRKPSVKTEVAPVYEDVLDLLAQERFAQALELLGSSTTLTARYAVLRAAAMLGVGDVASVEETCKPLLEDVDVQVDAHALLALAAEHFGDTPRAAEHHRSAIYLEPDFAISHLHLGRLARREGSLPEARRELEIAAALLEHEAVTRIAIFGGGFTRDGLLALCRSELALLARSS